MLVGIHSCHPYTAHSLIDNQLVKQEKSNNKNTYQGGWRRVCLQPDPLRPSIEPHQSLLRAVVVVVGAFGRVKVVVDALGCIEGVPFIVVVVVLIVNNDLTK